MLLGEPGRGLRIEGPDDDERALFVLAHGTLSAETRVRSFEVSGFDGLSAFFVDLEQNWRGWTGIRTWRSVEGEAQVDATHEGGRVRLAVRLQDSAYARWVASTDLRLGAGEDLAGAARDVVDLFG